MNRQEYAGRERTETSGFNVRRNLEKFLSTIFQYVALPKVSNLACLTVISGKKNADDRRFVDGEPKTMSMKRRLWIEVSVDLRWHPKLISSAKALNLPKVYLEGHLVNLWSGALEYAEDGDLWRGADDASLRFFESLAEIPGEPQRFLDVLRLDRWIDGWLIHDWLDHAAKYLITRYSSHNRERLEEIYAKHNRVYGRGGSSDNAEGTSQGKLWGSGTRVNVDNSDPPITLNPIPTTLNPLTLKETYKENPRGGWGGKNAGKRQSRSTTGFF